MDYPHPADGESGTIFRGLDGAYPIPSSRGGTPSSPGQGGSHPGQDGEVPSRSGPRSGPRVTPSQDWMGVQNWMGIPPQVRKQSSISSNCYDAGGIPLTFTQKDFVVLRFVTCALLEKHMFCSNRGKAWRSTSNTDLITRPGSASAHAANRTRQQTTNFILKQKQTFKK